MSARRSRQAREARKGPQGVPEALGAALSRSARQFCTTCRSRAIEWGTVGDVVQERHERGETWEDINEWLTRCADSFGLVVSQDLLGCDAWWCLSCGDYGAFSPVQSSRA